MTLYVLGGGPAGLATAQEVTEQTQTACVIIERDNVLGGLARTVAWPGVGYHDLGPHKIFSTDAGLMARVKALLPPDRWINHPKNARIFMRGHFIAYPPSPLSLMTVYGWPLFLRLCFSYGLALLRSLFRSRRAETFQEDLEARVGKGLAEALFYPIARKLWGPPEILDVKLARGRIQTPSLLELIKKVLNPSARTQFETLTYDYPQGGLGEIWRTIQARITPRATVLLEHTVTGLQVTDNKITRLDVQEPSGQTRSFAIGADDFVVSTLPLGLTIKQLRPWLGEGLAQQAQNAVLLNDLLLVFLHVDQKEVFADSWLIVPDPAIAFHRLSEQKAFDPGMVPQGTVLCAEIMGHAGSETSARSDDDLIASVLDGLAAMGVKNLPVLAARVIRLPRSYPVYKNGFQPALDAVLAKLDALANFRTIGRQGAFNYIGTLDAMDIGYGFGRWFASGRQKPWQAERERTGHYPVLD